MQALYFPQVMWTHTFGYSWLAFVIDQSSCLYFGKQDFQMSLQKNFLRSKRAFFFVGGGEGNKTTTGLLNLTFQKFRDCFVFFNNVNLGQQIIT